MHIFTADRGWVQLIPPTINEVWELVTFDEKTKKYVPDKSANGTLHMMGTRPGLPSADVTLSRYTGTFPSQDAVNFINWTKSKMIYFDDGERLVYQPHKLSKYS